MSTTPAQDLYAVHIGHSRPRADQTDAPKRPCIADVAAYSPTGRLRVIPLIVTEQIDWDALGLQPRWVGDDTTETVAALEPSIFSGHGAEEWKRFIAGARRRAEVALAVAFVGSLVDDDEPVRAVFGPSASVNIPGSFGSSIGGSRISLSRQPGLADGVAGADRDLAERIRTTRRVDLPWWSLDLSGSTFESTRGAHVQEPEGSLCPLLLSPSGEVVAAVWESPDRHVRFYVLPAMESWKPTLEWLSTRAVPEYVPTAARRHRAKAGDDPALQTGAEVAALAELRRLDDEYEQRRAAAETELATAQTYATAVRYPLLFESGAPLAAAVAGVLVDAGLTVVDLDDFFGDTISADLLVTDGHGRRLLVEVKSASRNAGERLVNDLARHLGTWPRLSTEPVDGGALIVNHQNRTPPAERSMHLFPRQEFIESLTFAALSTVQLFHWWRQGEFAALRGALFGADTEAVAPPVDPSPEAAAAKKRGLFTRRPRV